MYGGMRIFLVASAIFVGLANQYVIGTGGAPSELADNDWAKFTLILLAVVVAGFVTFETLLRLARQWLLSSRFFLRYVVMVFGICLGGILQGGLLAFIASLSGGSSNIYGVVPDTIEATLGGLVVGFIGAVIGGALGLAEGLVLAMPLAAILGLFRNGHQRARSRPAP
jgi:hypothetical protein